MRTEEIVGKHVTVVLGGGIAALKGVVTGGGGDTLFLEAKSAVEERPTQYRINQAQVVYIRVDEE